MDLLQVPVEVGVDHSQARAQGAGSSRPAVFTPLISHAEAGAARKDIEVSIYLGQLVNRKGAHWTIAGAATILRSALRRQP